MAIAAMSIVGDAETRSIRKYPGAAVGDVVDMTGAKVSAVGKAPLGIVIDVGGNTLDEKILVLRRGEIVGDAGLTPGNAIYSDGDGTYSQVEPAGGAGTTVHILGYALSATNWIVNISSYEKAV